jgi:uncharacterized protein YbjT (DUF2867 family)
MVTRRRTFTILTFLRAGLLALAGAAFITANPASAQPRAGQPASEARPAALVFGGSGQLGSDIVRMLVDAGLEVTVFMRPTSSPERLAGLPVEFVDGDVTVEQDVSRAFQVRRYDLVVDALGRAGADVGFFAISGRHIATWAKATGARQIILHSSVGVGNSRGAYPAERYAGMQALFEAKQAGERAVIDSGVPYTIIRNAVLRDPPAGTPEQARLVADERVYGTVSRRGLARLTLGCVSEPACANRIFHAVDDGLPVLR